MTDKMLSRKEGGVGYVTFNNPERHNAVSLDMWEATKRILDDFAADNDIRVVVLTGAGGKAFVSGADISKFESDAPRSSRARLQRQVRSGLSQHLRIPQADHRHDPRLLHRRRPGARHLLRPAHRSDNSRFAVPAAKLGLGYGYGGLKRLIDVVGPAFAKEIFYTARQFDAAGSARHGPRQPRRAVGRARRLGQEHHRHDLRQRAAHHQGGEIHRQRNPQDQTSAMSPADEMVEKCFTSNDYNEGRSAFMEKRKPAFTGT